MSEIELRDIAVTDIHPNPAQPRKHFAGLDELAASLQRDGQLMSVLVRPLADGFELVHGERRWRAAQIAGLATLRAEIREITPDEAFRLSLLENLQRESLSPVEEAAAFRTLLDGGMTQAALGALVGKSQQFVADRLALLRLPDEVQEMVTARAVSPSIARRLVTIDDPQIQKRLARQAERENLTVKDIEEERRDWQQKKHAASQSWDSFTHLTEKDTVLSQYAAAIEKGELRVMADEYLTPVSMKGEFTGQTWHWPKFSAAETVQESESFDLYGENLRLPVFTEDEWTEFLCFDEEAVLEALAFPGRQWFRLFGRGAYKDTRSPRSRRIYDPNYGRLIVEDDVLGPMFIRRGWGKWYIVAFNDGEGKRTRRRFFVHDVIVRTLIEEAMATVDPLAFSHHNFARMSLWRLQPHEMSWAYYRRKTISRDEAVAAMELDLERLRQAEVLTDDEVMERALDWLQVYPADRYNPHWREGVGTYPRRPDGTVDELALVEVAEPIPMTEAAHGNGKQDAYETVERK